MLYTTTLQKVNRIPAGTRVRVVSVEQNCIRILDEFTGQRVIMHQPAWWDMNIDMHPIRAVYGQI